MDIKKILVEIGVALVIAVLTYFLQSVIKENRKLRHEKEERESARSTAIEKGIVCLLRKHIMDEHEKWTSKGYITPKALESGIAMYNAYKGLGGNGMIDHMEEEIRALPIHE